MDALGWEECRYTPGWLLCLLAALFIGGLLLLIRRIRKKRKAKAAP
jgi:hypothetical protein